MSFNNMGKPIPYEKLEKANVMMKSIGIEDGEDRWHCIKSVASFLERDRPHEAMSKATETVDIIGAYRLFAELLS